MNTYCVCVYMRSEDTRYLIPIYKILGCSDVIIPFVRGISPNLTYKTRVGIQKIGVFKKNAFNVLN